MRTWVFLAIASVLFAGGPCQAADYTYTYDALGRLTNVVYACNKTTSYSFDSAGNRTSLATAPITTPGPSAVNDSISTLYMTAKTFDPRTNDTDPDCNALTISAVGAAGHGSTVNNSGTSITYTPVGGYNGADSFTYTVSDGKGGTSSATVSVTITGSNSPPVAVNDSIATNENTAKTFDPRANDYD
jgi:VCBS repeat-containing protein/YD repeat-containing protein